MNYFSTALFKNIRFYVLCFSFTLSLAVFFYLQLTSSAHQLEIAKLTQTYALFSVSYLYLALLPDGLAAIFPHFPFRAKYTKARRAIGVSAFYFAILHASLAFFGELGGFGGLPFLDFKYLLAITLSFTALIILSLMAFTSFDYWVNRLTFPRWKQVHRFVYLAAILITIHALMLGSHFTNLADILPQIFTGALIVLLLLEANRFDKFLSQKFFFNVETQTSNYPRLGALTLMVVIVSAIYLVLPFLSTSTLQPFNIHSQHIQIAKENQSGATLVGGQPTNPALVGDRRLRYDVKFDHADTIEAGVPTDLSFSIFFAGNGAPTYLYSFVYSKTMHLIIVNDNLTYFSHIHPTQQANSFKITTQFPNPGKYHLYINFQPAGAIEQQYGFELNVGGATAALAPTKDDFAHTKVFDGINVKLEPDTLSAFELNNFNQKMKFTLTDKNNQPVTNLKPYLAAFGHLVLINTQNYDYIHVHPTNLVAPKENETGGPSVEFMPLGLYSPINPGTYRVFAEFNPGGRLLTTDFMIKID